MHISVLSRHRYFEFFFLELLFEVLESDETGLRLLYFDTNDNLSSL